MIRTRVKPRIQPAAVPLLQELNRYIEQCDVRGSSLAGVAADVFDGCLTEDELRPLLVAGLVAQVDFEREPGVGDLVCGSSWSVVLTDTAMRAFWSGRMTEGFA